MAEKRSLTLTVITDTHYYSKEVGCQGKAYDRANASSELILGNAGALLDAAFRQIKTDKRTDIVLLSGDTTHDGELASHREFIEMLRDLKKAGKRVYVLTATHDYQDDGFAKGFSGDENTRVPAAKREQLFDMYKEFGPDEAIAVHRESMSYVVQLCDGYRLFALNDDSNLNGKSGFSDECFEWITKQAEDAKNNGQFIIAMTHHPLIAPSPVYELIGKNDMLGDYKIRREQLADLGIQYILTGHSHVHDIDKYVSEKGNTLYDISTAATVGYPGVIRTIVLDPQSGMVSTTTDLITEKVDFDLGGKSLQDYLKNQLVGIARDMIKAAGSDIHTFADMAVAISIKKKLIYQIGWLVKPFAKKLNSLTIGKVGKMTRAETGLSPDAYADIKDKSVVDFICDLVTNLYGGENLYNPQDSEYKITIGLMHIIDSVFAALHIKPRKLIKVSDSITDFVEPLLHNSGIPSYDAILPIMPYNKDGQKTMQAGIKEKECLVKKSKKGVPIVIIAVILLIVLFIPILLVAGFGFLINQIKYGKYMK